MVSLRLALSNPTLPEITDGYEIQLHHSLGHDRIFAALAGAGSMPARIMIDAEGRNRVFLFRQDLRYRYCE